MSDMPRRISTDEFLALAASFILERYGRGPERIKIDIGSGLPPWRASFPPVFAPTNETPARNGAAIIPPASSDEDTNDTVLDILEAATSQPMTRKALIRASGHPVNSHTYAVLRQLLDDGKLVVENDGRIRRAD
jgi:hypothetical protein